MNVGKRSALAILSTLAVGVFLGRRLLYPNSSLHAATFSPTSSQSYLVGEPFLNGSALVAQTGAPLQLTTSDEEENVPSIAQSGDDVYLAYTEKTIADLSFLARPAGGDQVLRGVQTDWQIVSVNPIWVTIQ